MTSHRLLRLAGALALAAAVAMAGRYAPESFRISGCGFVPPSFVTHTVMLVLSLAAIILLSKGRLALCGFTVGEYRFSPRILLWVLPTAALAVASAAAPSEPPVAGGPVQLTKLQLILFIWVYASISEEVLTRGLLQTLLGERTYAAVTSRRKFSMPVVVSALFFGAMHIMLFESMGPRAVPVILLVTLLGFVAAKYRENTGSLIPAVIVHALFNVGGMVPLWVIQWLRR
jgi:membrane protease YdiL (CAAX protease family)